MSTPDSFLPNWLARCARNIPGHLAVQSGQVQWNFAELDHRATRLARQLATAGVQEGSRIALLAGNGLSSVAFVHALIRLGAILVPLNVRLTLEELCWQVQDVHAMLLVSDERHTATAVQIGQVVPELLCATLADNVEAGVEWMRGVDPCGYLSPRQGALSGGQVCPPPTEQCLIQGSL